MPFIPYHSEKGTVDLCTADAAYRRALESNLALMRRVTTRWVPTLQFISERRPEMHWCSYDDGRVVAFTSLDREESFGDLQDIYDFIAGQVRHLQSLGNYKGEFVAEPDPIDDVKITWREWKFIAGDSAFVLNCCFAFSAHCKLVSDGTEMITVEKKRVVCGVTAEDLIGA